MSGKQTTPVPQAYSGKLRPTVLSICIPNWLT